MQCIISDGRARRIASEWHDGQRSPLYSFVSTGAITVHDAVKEIHHNLRLVVDRALRIELQELVAYVSENGDRSPVEGWSRIWE